MTKKNKNLQQKRSRIRILWNQIFIRWITSMLAMTFLFVSLSSCAPDHWGHTHVHMFISYNTWTLNIYMYMYMRVSALLRFLLFVYYHHRCSRWMDGWMHDSVRLDCTSTSLIELRIIDTSIIAHNITEPFEICFIWFKLLASTLHHPFENAHSMGKYCCCYLHLICVWRGQSVWVSIIWIAFLASIFVLIHTDNLILKTNHLLEFQFQWFDTHFQILLMFIFLILSLSHQYNRYEKSDDGFCWYDFGKVHTHYTHLNFVPPK